MTAIQETLELLRSRLSASSVVEGESLDGRRFSDWSGAAVCPPLGLLLPNSPEEVAAALAVCSERGQRISVAGGLTGLAGGANPQPDELVLSLAKLNHIEPIDDIGGTIIVGAGVSLENLQDHLTEFGWSFPLDLGSRGSCQLGGNAATNAGGNRVLRFGMMRDLVLGLEVALPDGTLLTMLDRVVKNNTGLDLKQLFMGSEGTLGVITRLCLTLEPLTTATRTALCALPSFQAATQLLKEARRLPGLASFELMWVDYFEEALNITGVRSPFTGRYPLYALVETLGADEDAASAGVESLLESALNRGLAQDVVLAQSLSQARGLWEIREAISELLGKLTPFAAFDVSIPLASMDAFVRDMYGALGARFTTQKHLFFGHLGDGNLHLLSGPYPDTRMLLEVEEQVYAAVGAAGGSISAEHGIGVVKKPFLHYARDARQIALMRNIKRILDPNGVLNAGRIFDA